MTREQAEMAYPIISSIKCKESVIEALKWDLQAYGLQMSKTKKKKHHERINRITNEVTILHQKLERI